MNGWGLALLLGLVEGATEFLPISSTGHLILTAEMLDFRGPRAEAFEIFIQLGAILAVVWEYRARLGGVVRELPASAAARAFAVKLGLAFLPAAGLGFLAHGFISERLYQPGPVAAALVVGAVLIFVVEALPLRASVHDVDGVGYGQALLVGLAQCCSLWPGFSRSAATILGGLGLGLDRRTATEFSFFLAIPTLFAATGYALLKNWRALAPGDLGLLLLSASVAFGVAWLSIRWLLRFVSTHSLRPFAWYRLVLGLVILLA
ncbi:MAG TPA: undecaprenyl-diphosphate phosphatase [Candidatus Polarisedimenticolaceae bacterium]|nr:undecaprenyl-diphosphate phosphatase [Candidatus Polarisedimenticolaceae bacterium]